MTVRKEIARTETDLNTVSLVSEPTAPKSAQQDAPEYHDAECAWVPGTTDRVRFTLLRQDARSLVRELAVTRLAVMFGRSVMDDLYLRGRARLRMSDVQLLELA